MPVEKNSSFVFALLLAVLLQSCASPARRLADRGIELGFSQRTLVARGFRLETFFKPGLDPGQVLHVYLEGDGLPWMAYNRIAADPTPRHPLMLNLMHSDRSPALYLGRPCYNGHVQDPGCSPHWWTDRRYAPEVVSAMAEALTAFLKQTRYSGVVFLGHSGGGALALLLAQQFAATRAVVTIAGNTDIDVWADYHRYTRLQGSLNPAHFAAGEYPEIHYLGESDDIIPAALFRPVLLKRRNALINTVAGFDHVCCWASLWSKILGQVP